MDLKIRFYRDGNLGLRRNQVQRNRKIIFLDVKMFVQKLKRKRGEVEGVLEQLKYVLKVYWV